MLCKSKNASLKTKISSTHAIEGVWMLGGFEETEEKKILFEVPDRSAYKLLLFQSMLLLNLSLLLIVDKDITD